MAQRRNGKITTLMSGMAYRPDPSEFDRPLTAAQLKEFHRTMSMLSPHQIFDAYQKAHKASRMEL